MSSIRAIVNGYLCCMAGGLYGAARNRKLYTLNVTNTLHKDMEALQNV